MAAANDWHVNPEVLEANPDTELLTRSIVGVLLNGPADENEEVIGLAGCYVEYSVLNAKIWYEHHILKDFTVDLTTVESRAR